MSKTEKTVVDAFAAKLNTCTEQAYQEVVKQTWKKDWDLNNAHVLNWNSARGTRREHRAIGYAIEARVYQLMGGTTGEFRGYRWGSQGSVLNKGTRPDFYLVLESGDKDRQALFDVTSDLLYNATGALHITSKSPSWTNSSKVAYAAEVQYPAFSTDLLTQLTSGTKLSQKKVNELNRALIEQKQQQYQDTRAMYAAVTEAISLIPSKRGENAFTRFRNWFFDGSIMGNATTEANNFLRAYGVVSITGIPSTKKQLDAPRAELNERWEERLEDLYEFLDAEEEDEDEVMEEEKEYCMS